MGPISNGYLIFFYAIFPPVSGSKSSKVYNQNVLVYLLNFPVQVMAKCPSSKCKCGLFESLITENDSLGPLLFEKFKNLFSRGLFENLTLKLNSSEIIFVFDNLFKNCSKLQFLYTKFYPFANVDKSNSVPKLVDLIRWNLRMNLLNEDFLIFNQEIPVHVYKILNYYS